MRYNGPFLLDDATFDQAAEDAAGRSEPIELQILRDGKPQTRRVPPGKLGITTQDDMVLDTGVHKDE